MAREHPQSVLLDHCWVCHRKFVFAGGTEQPHYHHIIPRAFGGTDGPEVSLCDTCHSTAHRIAEQLIKDKPYHQFLQGRDAGRQKHLMWLATRIHQSYLAVQNDPNKATSVSFTLKAADQKLIDDLKPILNVKSREAVILKCVALIHSRHFMK